MWGVNDVNYMTVRRPKTHYLLFMLAVVPKGKNAVTQFRKDLDTIRGINNYVDDYPFDFRDRKLHMVVLRVHERWRAAYHNFIQGNFSKMFTREELGKVRINEFTIRGKLNLAWVVLMKDPRYKRVFRKQIEDFFGVSLNIDPDEYDSFIINPTYEEFNVDKPGKPNVVL